MGRAGLKRISCNDHLAIRALGEPAFRGKNIYAVQIGSSRTMDLFGSVPPAPPKVFLVCNYVRVVYKLQPGRAITEAELLIQL